MDITWAYPRSQSRPWVWGWSVQRENGREGEETSVVSSLVKKHKLNTRTQKKNWNLNQKTRKEPQVFANVRAFNEHSLWSLSMNTHLNPLKKFETVTNKSLLIFFSWSFVKNAVAAKKTPKTSSCAPTALRWERYTEGEWLVPIAVCKNAPAVPLLRGRAMEIL